MSNEKKSPSERHQLGQSIVLIAAGMVALIGFLGLVVDLGVIWARDAQLAAAVDAAALAAATELSSGGIEAADAKATQFLYTNQIPQETIGSYESTQSMTLLGAIEYSITVTWDVELYFMRIFGFDTQPLTKSATAAYFPLVDLYASSRVEDGAVGVANQGIFGPAQSTASGDPYSPLTNNQTNDGDNGVYTYKYRIYIPPDYESEAGTSIVRVELFDPDSQNNTITTTTTIVYSERFKTLTGLESRTASCSNSYHNTCIIPTCEWSEQDSGSCSSINNNFPELDDPNNVNPYWFIRVDENRRPAGQSTTSYNVVNNTRTEYKLYYYQQLPDGTLVQTDLASYVGRTGDTSRDRALTPPGGMSISTDLQWVSPGAFNVGLYVPTECGSFNGGHECGGTDSALPTDFGSGRGFEIDLNNDTPNMVVDSVTGARYIYMGITALSGSSENGFEVWAGPPSASIGWDTNANVRNLKVADEPNTRSSFGVTVLAMGILPMNSNAAENVDIPLLYVPASFAGREISISMFDPDSGAKPPITFYFDTISQQDYSITYGTGTDPEGRCFDGGSAYDGECQNSWVTPMFVVPVPQLNSAQCQATGDPEDCNPFYGGRLMANYNSGAQDTFTWKIILPSLPFLSR